MDIYRQPIYGSLLTRNPLVGGKPFVSIQGICNEIMSKHILMSGGTGSGKTNAFYHILGQLRNKITNDDVIIVFDTKGDYHKHFGRVGDIVLGNSTVYKNKSVKWNVYREILSDGWDIEDIENNVHEIAWSVFRNAIDKSKDPFFPNAARDLFAGILLCMMETGANNIEYRKKNFNNAALKQSLDRATVMDVKALLEAHPRYASVASYIGDGKNGQALGVYAEMLGNVRKILTGVFADTGSFSIRNFVREKKAKVFFVEYDLAMGDMLSAMYSLLIDLALKEVLGRTSHVGSVYLFCDEFRLLPYLQHIDDGVNFGRSLGLKIIAGIQSVNQLTELYGEAKGKNILAGFSSVFAFRANDPDTRRYITDLYGENIILEQRKTLGNGIMEEEKRAHVVEDWDIRNLNLGEAIIGLPFCEPFQFQFDLFT